LVSLKVEPGAPNVIPGRAEFPVELRDLDDAKVVRMWEHVIERFRQADKEEGVDTRCESTDDVKSARATPAIQAAIREAERLLYAQHIEANGKQLFQEICSLDLEGIVAKRSRSTYRASRSFSSRRAARATDETTAKD
jgi:metal-dependent amidase/aminoacylase/carboxypeptidase family protein